AAGGSALGLRYPRMTGVSVGARGKRALALFVARAGVRFGVAGLLLLGANKSLQNAVAEGDTRTISFHHVHTGEDITITYKRDGRYDEAALKKLDWFMRDWRKEKETHMDPHLFDLLWETYRSVGGKEPIQVICGYRSPGTNAMLRARSRASGVAEFSQHINGNAIDFYIPGVSLAQVRAEGLRLQRGGVGFYPTSGSPFVHMDTGTIRHWPRIARQELVKIFPDGKTVHIPADGHPLPGYAVALADVERHGAVPSGTSLEAARAAGVITASEEQLAVTSGDENAAVRRPKRSLLASIFGGDEHEDQAEQAAPKQKLAMAPAGVSPRKVATEPIVPLPAARPRSVTVASILPQPRPAEPKMTASIPVKLLDDRGAWRGAAVPGSALPAPIAAGTRYEMASAEAVRLDDNALAYANDQASPLAARARPMGSRLPQMAVEARVLPAADNSTMVVKPPVAAAMGGGPLSDSPWLRATTLTPSVRYMSTSRVGAVDPRWMGQLLHKPAQALAMSFSADPHFGMVADRFDGRAVVFLATTTFTAPQTTASLR
ncbi:MAG TPA: DUF882 domain-containing protein, partial [Pseudolabrys sp.]|nr:DUF882 domain-containing protein [Pseudolabrys sp.]